MSHIEIIEALAQIEGEERLAIASLVDRLLKNQAEKLQSDGRDHLSGLSSPPNQSP
jgi:hypothetical protein